MVVLIQTMSVTDKQTEGQNGRSTHCACSSASGGRNSDYNNPHAPIALKYIIKTDASTHITSTTLCVIEVGSDEV